MNLDNPWIVFASGLMVGGAAAVYPWVKWLHEIRQKRKEKEGREKAEAELKLIRRRGDAPFLALDESRFEQFLFPPAEPGKIRFVRPGSSMLLCYARQEVERDTPGNHAVMLVFENRGLAADKIKVTLEGHPVTILSEPDIRSANGLVALQYDYHRECHGQEQTFIVWFQARNGFEDTHRYRTRHGIRELERVDPP